MSTNGNKALRRSDGRRALVTSLAILLTACGGSSGGGGGGSTAAPAPTPTPAPSTGAQRWQVELAATQQPFCLRPGAALALNVAAFTSTDGPIANPTFNVTSNVAGAVERDSAGAWIVRGEGATRITVTYTGEVTSGTTVAPVNFDVLRDGQPPQVAVHSPARAAMVTSSGDVRVQGLVTDATSPVRSVIVNGVEQLTAPVVNHPIDVSPPGTWGLNVVAVEATDSCGNTATLSQSYLRSTEYRPPAVAASTPARVSRGQGVRFTQAALDDGNRNDADDAATLIQRVLERSLTGIVAQATSGEVLINQSVACPGAGFYVRVDPPGASVLGPRIDEISLRTGGTRQVVGAQRVSVPLRVEQITRVGIPLTGCVETRIPFSASVSAGFTSTSNGDASVVNGRVDVSIPTISVTLSNVQIAFTGNAAVDGALSGFASSFNAYVEDAIEDVLRSELPLMLETFLNSPVFVRGSVSSGPFDATLAAVAGIDSISIVPAAATQTLYTQIHPAGTGTAHPALGAIARPTVAPNLATYTRPLAYFIDDNLVNQGLWALWQNGALELPNALGFSGMTLSVSGLLPPVLMPGAQPSEVRVGFGDLDVTLTLPNVPNTTPPVTGPVVVDAYVSHVAEGTVAFDSATKQVRMTTSDRTTHVHVTRIAQGTTEITDPALRARLKTYAENLMTQSIDLLVDEMLSSTLLVPPLTFPFGQPIAGAVDLLELEVQGLARTADHTILDMILKVGLASPPNGTLTTNIPWTQQDLQSRGVPPVYWNTTTHIEDDNAAFVPKRSITVNTYNATTRVACDAAGTTADDKEICLPEWVLPLDYGWYCGGGRPVVGFKGNPVLDPVDYCCVLHDQLVWAESPPNTGPASWPAIAEAQARNACGAAMCFGQASYQPADIAAFLPDVERARRRMYEMAMLGCVAPPL